MFNFFNKFKYYFKSISDVVGTYAKESSVNYGADVYEGPRGGIKIRNSRGNFTYVKEDDVDFY